MVSRVSRERAYGGDHYYLLCFFRPSYLFWLARIHRNGGHNNWIAFLGGPSAAVVGVIVVVTPDLIPSALVDLPTIIMSLTGFFVIVLLKLDVAKVAFGAMAGGIVYAIVHHLQ